MRNVVVRTWSEWLNMYRNYYGQYLVENVFLFFQIIIFFGGGGVCNRVLSDIKLQIPY